MTVHADLSVLSRSELEQYCHSLEILAHERSELLAAAPQCPADGPCFPYAMYWIRRFFGHDEKRTPKMRRRATCEATYLVYFSATPDALDAIRKAGVGRVYPSDGSGSHMLFVSPLFDRHEVIAWIDAGCP